MCDVTLALYTYRVDSSLIIIQFCCLSHLTFCFSASARKNEHMYPYSSRPMTTQQITLRSQGSASNRPLNTTGLKGTSRRPQSGYERGLAGTLQKNDGWRDESLLSNAGKISFYPLSFDVLETLSFAPAKTASGSVQKVRLLRCIYLMSVNGTFNSCVVFRLPRNLCLKREQILWVKCLTLSQSCQTHMIPLGKPYNEFHAIIHT